MNKLRTTLQEILSGTESFRPAALRRSLRKEYIYATDLPRCAESTAVQDFCRRAELAAWIVCMDGDWIQLDYSGVNPEDTCFGGPFGREAECCAELLRRHPNGRKSGENEMRMLIKAGEEGPEAYEKICAGLHREWAAALRRKDLLPDLPESCFRKVKKK